MLLSLEKAPLNDFGKQFPVPKNTAARKIGNVVIPLLWQLRFHWNPHQNKSSSLYNTTVLTPGNFSKSLFIAVSLFSNVGDIDLESDYTEPQVGLFFVGNVANYEQFFHKIKFARTFKNVFSLRDLGLENIFSVIIKRLLIFILIFSIPTFRGAFFCIYNGCLN